MNGATPEASAAPEVLDRATLTGRRAAVHAALLDAMQTVERYRGALALLDDLLSLADPPGPEAAA